MLSFCLKCLLHLFVVILFVYQYLMLSKSLIETMVGEYLTERGVAMGFQLVEAIILEIIILEIMI